MELFFYVETIILIAAIIVLGILIFKYRSYKEENYDNLLNHVSNINVKYDENLEKHAKDISTIYLNIDKKNVQRKNLIKDLDLSFKKIISTYEFIDKEGKEKKEVVPASEWILDNLYLIEKEYKGIIESMPKNYYNELPLIDKEMMKGYPRIYHLAIEMISHTDGFIDQKVLKKFIKSYQNNTILTMAELWAIPIMLRIALIQNISRICEKIFFIQKERVKAENLGDTLINAFTDNRLKEEVKKLYNLKLDFNPFFSERLLKILRNNGIDNIELYNWIEEGLDNKGLSFENIIITAHNKESYYELTLGNSIKSIREIDSLNWKDDFEELSKVHEILTKDPINEYGNMDFKSRDYYRHKITELSKKLKKQEIFIAKKALECAKNAKEAKEKPYLKHVGYYIFDNGLEELVDKINDKISLKEKILFYIRKHNVGFYLGSIVVFTILLISLFLTMSFINDSNIKTWKYIIGFFVLLIPCSEIVISILNWSVTHLIPIRFIPKLDLEKGIGEENRTVVIIPALINNKKAVKELLQQLEVYYLGNKDENIYFALLGDFKDSKNEIEKEDKDIIDEAIKETEKLNKKYCFLNKKKFFFLCRYRQFNPKEGYYLAWERKRGKIVEFNSLLKGDKKTSYNVISSDIKELKKAKYIITLDADTKLPRDSAKKLIGAMAHILNIPHLDKDNKKVIRGYGLLQPRISISTVSANKTLFSKVLSGETGIDTYSTAISDVYQDLFGEGIFTGKGIYNLELFSNMLKDEIPENLVLSHDLLEGSYVRAGLVSDVELIDGYPAYYNASIKRLHRWVRGDWQLLSWLNKKTVLGILSKWKILDNLRRSLLAPNLVILIVLGLLKILPDGLDKWFMVAFLTLVIPIIFDVTENVVIPMKDLALSGRIKSNKMVLNQFLLIFIFLPHKAVVMLDAIFRTLYRLFFSKRHLLQWQTADDVEKTVGRRLSDFIKLMWSASLLSICILILSFLNSIYLGTIMIIPCILWFLSPLIAYYVSLSIEYKKIELSEEEQMFLRKVSRKTWAYFEDFVNEDNNWLGPDNYQEYPTNGVAYRTSPTNIGMTLTSNIVALDMGYIGLVDCLERFNKTIESMSSLEKYNGHFYNWYSTKNMEPLYPRFISTVDSGNLVGYLWLCAKSLEEYLNKPLIDFNIKKGINDILILGNEELKNLSIKENELYKIKLDENKEIDLIEWRKSLINIFENLKILYRKENNLLYWNSRLKKCIQKNLEEIDSAFPWLKILIEKNISKEIENKLLYLGEKTDLKNISDKLYELEEELLKSNKDEDLINSIKNSRIYISSVVNQIQDIIMKLYKIGNETDFKFLYNKKRGLLSIGFDIENNILNNTYYDLLASEARQASFVAIAKGDIPKENWFKLGRAMTLMGRNKGLVSWTGTMFEYFMPLLIMRTYPNTILNSTYNAVIEGQKIYAQKRGVPWGISESGFYAFDIDKNYQYKAFGVPGLGLKRGLIDELVIAPYATILALQKDLKDSLRNLKLLQKEGMEGTYGFYEAIDYTKDRIRKNEKREIIKSFMIHHEGMSLMALDNVLNKNILQKRFHSIPSIKATELLLQEKIPNNVLYDRELKFNLKDVKLKRQKIVVRKYITAKTIIPEIQLLSNSKLALMISNSGSGYTKYEDTFLYRWREDITEDNTGLFIYIRNSKTGEYWSATYAPTLEEGEDYEVTFSIDKAEFNKLYKEIFSKTKVIVSTEDNSEIRKIVLENLGSEDKIIDIISYAEVVLAGYDGDLVHQTFSNLFITTEFIENPLALISKRRPRAKGKNIPYLMHTVTVNGELLDKIEYETARVNFIGRGRTKKNPIALEEEHLTDTTGVVLDPIVSLKTKVRIPKGEKVEVNFVTAYCKDEKEAIKLAKKYREINNITRVEKLVSTSAQMEMRYLGIKSLQANLYQDMASRIFYVTPLMKKREKYIKNIKKGQSTFWTYGISGDLPIIILIIKEQKNIEKLRQLLSAHEYWSLKGLKVDLVIINEEVNSYHQPLQRAIMDTIYSNNSRDKFNKSGGVFLLNKGKIEDDDIDLFKAIARVVINGEGEFLKSQIKVSNYIDLIENINRKEEINNNQRYVLDTPKLEFYNEYGGFSEDGSEYIIHLKEGVNTPAPWINVIGNKQFGFHVSESGSAYTWSKNSRENKITHWNNDWISDVPSEVLYIRDEDTGVVWNITPRPIRGNNDYKITHGFGYSKFLYTQFNIEGEETMFTPMEKKLKIIKIRLKNIGNEVRKLSLSYYAHLVMGVVPAYTVGKIATFYDEKEFLYAKNPYNLNFAENYAFLKFIGLNNISYTGSRTEFIGRGRTVENPEALEKERLSNIVGAGMDSCLALKGDIILEKEEEKEIFLLFGEENGIENIYNVINYYEDREQIYKELQNTIDFWRNTLDTIKIKTPEKSLDFMVNGWLMYQTIVCRLWARTAFYQSGGAFGFRDQLQDVMPVVYLKSNISREQIVYSASRQFLEGDVQHWWHPGVESGIRTRFSDDLLWLPYVIADYISNTGDYSVLDEEVSYLEDAPLNEGEDERYSISPVSSQKGSIYEHCIKAIEKSLKFGPHNIPLMGSGDWNDGMSTVGNKGTGESVWLGWFLYSILDKFMVICEYKNDKNKVKEYEKIKENLKEAINNNAWDGEWYRRAYFDDGTPLGSHENEECKIDSLSQSWAVISGAGEKDKVDKAINSLQKYLIKEKEDLILLLTPAFYKSDLEPGYIKGYVPGVRENGGQYTHASTWVILAMCKLKRQEMALKLFNMINPINHTDSKEKCDIYKTEPYVMTADVYGVEPHIGRGGWSWYTGTSGWMYRVAIEGILGLKLENDKGFKIDPCIPKEWNEYSICYKKDSTKYNIKVIKGSNKKVTLDGKVLENDLIPYVKDGKEHNIEVFI